MILCMISITIEKLIMIISLKPHSFTTMGLLGILDDKNLNFGHKTFTYLSMAKGISKVIGSRYKSNFATRRRLEDQEQILSRI